MGSRHACQTYAARQCLRKTPGGAKLQLNTKFGGPVSRKPASAGALLYTALNENAP